MFKETAQKNSRSLSLKAQLKTRAVLFVATVGGLGLSPWAPGTLGSLAGWGLVWLLRFLGFGLWSGLFFWFAILVLGVWAAIEYDLEQGSQDNPSIVVDEVLGMALILTTDRGFYWDGILAFILFRFFDICKLQPVRWVDQLSKKSLSVRLRAFGVIADDLLAAFQGICLIWIIRYYFKLT